MASTCNANGRYFHHGCGCGTVNGGGNGCWCYCCYSHHFRSPCYSHGVRASLAYAQRSTWIFLLRSNQFIQTNNWLFLGDDLYLHFWRQHHSIPPLGIDGGGRGGVICFWGKWGGINLNKINGWIYTVTLGDYPYHAYRPCHHCRARVKMEMPSILLPL